MVLPPGEFEMGGSQGNEQPKHTVSIGYTIAIGMFEVSQKELRLFCDDTGTICPAQPWDNSLYPAVNVSWDLANQYLAWLSEQANATYRLPSEAEWEYATRAGTTSPYPFGDELVPTDARFSFQAAQTRPFETNDRSVNANEFRLYHTVGNVREWVLDGWSDNHSGAPTDGSARSGNSGAHVVRGGSYADRADALRSAAREQLGASGGDAVTGFRVVREIR